MSESEEAARLLKGLEKECNMLATTPNLDSLADLASQLSPREQLELLARIGQHLGVALEQPANYLPGSAAAVLQAVSRPPHLDDQQ